MRVLPYFNSVAQSAKSARSSAPAAKQASLPEETPKSVAKTTDDGFRDMFIPSSPVKGVVMKSAAAETAVGAEGSTAKGSEKVLKSGTYSFYRLDGKLEKDSPAPVSAGLNLLG